MRIRRRGALAAACACLLASCGGDGDDESGGGSGGGAATTLDFAASVLGDRVQRFLVSGRSHVPGRVDYPQTPPVGGDHNATWQNCGFYSLPIVPELAVHSMEHGAVWIVFRPGLSGDQVGLLRQLAQRPYVLVSPWPDDSIPAPVVASAWGLQVRADTASDPVVPAFVQVHASGPQTPERGAPCTGAFGTPE